MKIIADRLKGLRIAPSRAQRKKCVNHEGHEEHEEEKSPPGRVWTRVVRGGMCYSARRVGLQHRGLPPMIHAVLSSIGLQPQAALLLLLRALGGYRLLPFSAAA